MAKPRLSPRSGKSGQRSSRPIHDAAAQERAEPSASVVHVSVEYTLDEILDVTLGLDRVEHPAQLIGLVLRNVERLVTDVFELIAARQRGKHAK
jgi:hypothetical protein